MYCVNVEIHSDKCKYFTNWLFWEKNKTKNLKKKKIHFILTKNTCTGFFFYHVSISKSLMIMKSIFTNETWFSEMNENDVWVYYNSFRVSFLNWKKTILRICFLYVGGQCSWGPMFTNYKILLIYEDLILWIAWHFIS